MPGGAILSTWISQTLAEDLTQAVGLTEEEVEEVEEEEESVGGLIIRIKSLQSKKETKLYV